VRRFERKCWERQAPAAPAHIGLALSLEPVDEIDHVLEPATSARADAAFSYSDGKMGLAGSSSTHEHGVALLADESAAGEVIDECLVDRCAFELEVVEVLAGRQGGGETC
jgi:hypothetical protein